MVVLDRHARYGGRTVEWFLIWTPFLIRNYVYASQFRKAACTCLTAGRVVANSRLRLIHSMLGLVRRAQTFQSQLCQAVVTL